MSLFPVHQALLGSTVARICQLFPPLAKEGRVQRDPTQDSWTNYTLERVRWEVFSTTTTHHQVGDDTIDTCCDPRNAWPGFYVMQKTPPNPSQNSSPFYFSVFLRILLKQNTILLSVRPSVCHRRDISHSSHKGINAMSIIRGYIYYIIF